MTSRLSDLEARAAAASLMAIGDLPGVNLLRRFQGITRKRAVELEALWCDLTAQEIEQIRALIPDAK